MKRPTRSRSGAAFRILRSECFGRHFLPGTSPSLERHGRTITEGGEKRDSEGFRALVKNDAANADATSKSRVGVDEVRFHRAVGVHNGGTGDAEVLQSRADFGEMIGGQVNVIRSP